MPYKNVEDRRSAMQQHFQNNKEKYANAKKKARQACREYVIRLKTEAVCADCLVNHPHYVLEFDHVRGQKIKDVNRLVRDGTLKNVIAEIEKCDIVCSNCHAIRTWERLQITP